MYFDSLSVDISIDIEKVTTSLTRDYEKRLLRRRRRRELTTFSLCPQLYVSIIFGVI